MNVIPQKKVSGDKVLIVSLVIIYILFPMSLLSQNKSTLEQDNISGKVRVIYEYEYSVDGEGYYKNNLNIKDISKYNEYGNITHSKQSFLNHGIVKSTTFEYDSDNKLVRTYSKHHNNNPNELNFSGGGNIYTYDQNGLLIKRQYQNPNGHMGTMKIYTNDDKGFLIESKDAIIFMDTTYRNIFSYKNDNTGRVMGYSYLMDQNSEPTSSKYIYDINGNVIVEEDYRGKILESINRYEYSNFEKNNWLLKKSFMDNELYQITERSIEYYH